MKQSTLRKLAIILMGAVLFTALAGLGVFYAPDMSVSDWLYQEERASVAEVMVIGIDAKALADFGPWPWSREIMAMVIETLNQDEENRPAVIGIDVFYGGESDPYVDEWLVEAAGQYGNVVVATYSLLGSQYIVQDGMPYYDHHAVLSYEEPFEALKNVTQSGHINAMYDEDGVLRHSLLYIDPPDYERVYSFNWMIYNLYCQYHGLPAPDMPSVKGRFGAWYLPMTSKPGRYYEFSVADVLDGAVPSDHLEGRIVLIGPYDAALQDSYKTAIDHSIQMYGIEIQANAIDALAAGEYKTELSDRVQLAILFVLSILCLLWFWERKMLPATLGWLLVAGGWLGICKLAYSNGIVLHVLWVPLAITVLYIITVAINYIRATLEKRKISNTFKRYVAPEIVTELLREGTDALGLGGKLTDISVLFVDIRGFTTMSEVLTPPQVVEILNQYLTLTTDCVMRNHGTLDKFVGDCTMAIWNAPLAQEDYIYKAVKAAQDMVEGSRALSQKLQEEFGRTVSFGVGVHCGPAVVGNIGAEMRMDFTAIGDTVNTAARLESNAPAGTIFISRAVADALEGRIETTSLGDSIKLKGKADGFEILRLEAVFDVMQ